MPMTRTLGATLLLAFSMIGVATAETSVLVMPIDVESFDLTALRAQPNEATTQSATDQLEAALRSYLREDPKYRLVEAPQLAPADQKRLDDHLRLYAVVATNAATMIVCEGLKPKRKNFDYTIGSGLAFLAEQSGAERLFILTGVHQRSTVGRLVSATALAGIGVQYGFLLIQGLGNSHAILGEVDLRTGDLIWANYLGSLPRDLAKSKNAEKVVRKLLEKYPKGRLLD